MLPLLLPKHEINGGIYSLNLHLLLVGGAGFEPVPSCFQSMFSILTEPHLYPGIINDWKFIKVNSVSGSE